MSSLKIVKRQNGNVVVLDMEGKIRIGEESVALRDTLRELSKNGEKQILVNLANVSHVDSSGLGELVGGFVSIQKNDGELKLLNLTDRISELMMITKLLTVFDVYSNEEAAVNSFQLASDVAKTDESAPASGH